MTDVPFEGVNLNPGPFLAQAIDEGLSMNQALRTFRDAGMSMSNQSFRSMFAEVRDALAERDAIAGLSYDAIPPGEAYTDWAAGAEGQYATFVTSFTRMPGEREIETRYYTFVTSEPHTPQEAIDAAADFYTSDAVGGAGTPQGVYQGSVVTSMTRTIGGG